MVLNYWEISITASEFIDKYLPKQDFYWSNGKYYGADPHEAFAGNPYAADSLGCFPKVIVKALDYMKSDNYAGMESLYYRNVSGISIPELIESYVSRDIPVLLWCTMSMVQPGSGMQYYLEDGSLYTWKSNEHCMVLCGYDENNYYLRDPLNQGAQVKYSKALVETRYNQMGKYAVVVYKKF